MIVTFGGHSRISNQNIVREKVYETLKGLDTSERIDFYLGGYGDFDSIALSCCRKYKKEINSNVNLYFVTPYLSERYIKRNYIEDYYDGIIYPEIENVPLKFAISKRNFWMAEQADIVIVCINNSWGGAAEMLRYSLRTNKNCINLGNYVLL